MIENGCCFFTLWSLEDSRTFGGDLGRRGGGGGGGGEEQMCNDSSMELYDLYNYTRRKRAQVLILG